MTEPFRWTADQVASIADQRGWELPVLRAQDVQPLRPAEVVWDMWQVMYADGATVVRDGRSFWFFLAAPRVDDPDERHDEARIRLTSHGADGWRDHGVAFADGFAPGSREWSGSAVLDGDDATLTMYFTAAGRRGMARTFEQRLFESVGWFAVDDGVPSVGGWSEPVESIVADGDIYRRADQAEPVGGRIKGFRDPSYFRDPADGAEYLLFVGSAGWVDTVDDGVIGLARRDHGRWVLLPPLVTAIDVNSELERPHVIVHDSRYWLFWSTQAARFAEGLPDGVTGVYAVVGDSMAGPWRPANGTCLVAGNPRAVPAQAYCWWVTGELAVASFVDRWGGGEAVPDPGLRRFGGAPAPFFTLVPEDDRITLSFDG